MKRRELIAGLGGTAVWPLAASGQQAAKTTHDGSTRLHASTIDCTDDAEKTRTTHSRYSVTTARYSKLIQPDHTRARRQSDAGQVFAGP
jgi:hypothetical protein